MILGVLPFYLFLLNEQDRHLCPVRTYAHWLNASKIAEGYLFHCVAPGDHLADNRPDGSALVSMLLFTLYI